MNTNISEIKNMLANIIDINKIEILEYIEDDKIYVKLQLQVEDDEAAVKDSVIKFLKVDLHIPKVKYEAVVTRVPAALANAKKIIISSGKGGVGKSFVTSNLANVLSKRGFKVAIIDADIYGSSIPMIFDLESSPQAVGEKIKPMQYENIELIGTSNINPNNEPIVWRGPMLGRLIKSFFNDVLWSDNIDFLLVDLPPGTGDVPLDLNGIIPEAKSIVVTTPHKNASKVAIFAGEIAKIQKHELIGVVENMSYYNHNGEHLHIFGKNGGDFVANTLGSEVLAKLPIMPPIDEKLYSSSEEAFDLYNVICDKIIKNFEKK